MTMPAPAPPSGTPQSPATSTASGSASSSTQTMSYVPYFTAGQLEMLYTRQRASKMAESKWQSNRNVATGFIQAVSSRLSFPQRTTATAQILYQRFHLFFPPSDFVLHEVALASLFLACKLNDTPKKAREILLSSYALRFPELVKDDPERSVSESEIDPSILETDRKRLLALEKLLLESICFNFQLRAQTTLLLVIKLCRVWGMGKTFASTAWRIAADMHRTTAPLQYTPNVVAVASIYTAALLAVPPPSQLDGKAKDEKYPIKEPHSTDELESIARDVIAKLAKAGNAAVHPPSQGLEGYEKMLGVHTEDVEEAVYELLDLYLSHCASTSTATRRELFSPPPFGLSDWLCAKETSGTQLSAVLTDIKIYLRGIEYERQKADDAFLLKMGVDAVKANHKDARTARIARRRLVAANRTTLVEPPIQHAIDPSARSKQPQTAALIAGATRYLF